MLGPRCHSRAVDSPLAILHWGVLGGAADALFESVEIQTHRHKQELLKIFHQIKCLSIAMILSTIHLTHIQTSYVLKSEIDL